MVNLQPALLRHLIPPRCIPFVACHDNMADIDALARFEFVLDLLHTASDDRDWSKALLDRAIAAVYREVAMSYVNRYKLEDEV